MDSSCWMYACVSAYSKTATNDGNQVVSAGLLRAHLDKEQLIIDLMQKDQPYQDHNYTSILGRKRFIEVRRHCASVWRLFTKSYRWYFVYFFCIHVSSFELTDRVHIQMNQCATNTMFSVNARWRSGVWHHWRAADVTCRAATLRRRATDKWKARRWFWRHAATTASEYKSRRSVAYDYGRADGASTATSRQNRW